MNILFHIAPGQLDGETVLTVNARDLHQFLGVETRFNDWIVRRIEEYGFEEGKDFCYLNLSSKDGRGGHNRIDYHLSIDMGKELSMVERNEKGRQARRCLIACERRAKAARQPEPLGVDRGLARLEQAALGLAGCARLLSAMADSLSPYCDRSTMAEGVQVSARAVRGLTGCATQTLADGQAALETLRQDLAACLVAASQAKPPVSPEASARARKAAQKLGGGHGCRA